MNSNIRQTLCDMGFESSIVFDNPEYDNAIIGVTDDGLVAYDFEKMIACLVNRDGMEEDEAIEFIEYNAIRSLPYITNAPIVIYPLPILSKNEVQTL